MAWTVYVLRCRDGSLYTGATNDLPARLARHQAGKGAAYTRCRRPVKVVFEQRVRGRSAALKKEHALKQLARPEKLALIRAAKRGLSARGTRVIALALGGTLSACEPAPVVGVDGGSACPELFRAAADGSGCEPVLPIADCPAGQMPFRGIETCQPVGWTNCPAGFEADPSGWGCREILPQAPCSAATSERLGQRTCAPVGDCSAPFPPPNATFFVDDSYLPSQLDARHTQTIFHALQNAPAGAVIAVDEGSYFESNAIDRRVAIIGRCAAKVTVDGLDSGFAGFWVRAAQGVEIAGVTLTRHRQSIQVSGGGTLTLRACVLDNNQTLGVYVTDAGSRAVVQDSVIRSTRPDAAGVGAGAVAERGGSAELERASVASSTLFGVGVSDASSRLVLRDSVVRATQPGPNGTFGRGIVVQGGARLDAERVAVIANHDAGVFVAGSTSQATLKASVVRQTRAPNADGKGFGISVAAGGSIAVSDSAIVSNAGVGIVVAEKDAAGRASSAAVTASVIRDTLPLLVPRQNPGTVPQYAGWGLAVEFGARLELRSSAVVDNREVALAVALAGSEASVFDSIVANTQGNRDGALGRGVAVQFGAKAVLERTALVGHRELGVDAAGSGSRAVLADCIVSKTGKSEAGPLSSVGVLGRLGGRLDLTRTVVGQTSGVAVTVAGGTATVAASHIADNTVGLHVQDGVSLMVAPAIVEPVEPLSAVVTSDTQFVRNETRLGAGAVPLPPLLGSAP